VDRLEIASRLLPGPLGSLPAKYHAPVSLFVHSTSTGWLASELAYMLGLDHGLAFLLGLAHDLHQKLVGAGLSTLRVAKEYIRERLEGAGLGGYARYIEDALELDACGKGNPVPGVDRGLSLVCHVADMLQGRLGWPELLYWLEKKLKELDRGLSVGYYSVSAPQPFARSYVMSRLYERHLEGRAVAVASPWGLIAVGWGLPGELDLDWGDLRLPGWDSGAIGRSRDEERHGLWERFDCMFGPKGCGRVQLPRGVEGLFVNIRLSGVEFRDAGGGAYVCGLCGLKHSRDMTLVPTMWKKASGADAIAEKWNKFSPAHSTVKVWMGSRGLWGNRVGMCPLCALDAVGARAAGIRRAAGFATVSFPKPVPVELLRRLARAAKAAVEGRGIELSDSIAGERVEGIVIDYSSATISAPLDVEQLGLAELAEKGYIAGLGRLVGLGLYPVKVSAAVDTSVPDRPAVLPFSAPLLDFPVTDQRYRQYIPFVAALLEALGGAGPSAVSEALSVPPWLAPLYLLSLQGEKWRYDEVAGKMASVGWRL